MDNNKRDIIFQVSYTSYKRTPRALNIASTIKAWGKLIREWILTLTSNFDYGDLEQNTPWNLHLNPEHRHKSNFSLGVAKWSQWNDIFGTFMRRTWQAFAGQKTKENIEYKRFKMVFSTFIILGVLWVARADSNGEYWTSIHACRYFHQNTCGL